MPRRLRRLYVSASALGNYCACQNKFLLSREWKPIGIEEPAYFAHGKEVHKIMDGSLAPMDASKKAAKAAVKLKAKANEYGLVAQETELLQKIKLDGYEVDGYEFKKVTLTRIIDVVGRDRDGSLLVDWKTAGKPWMFVKNEKDKYVAPKGSGFQPVLYLLPEAPGVSWPDRIRFFIAPGGGAVQTFQYSLLPDDVTNVFRMIAEMEQKWRGGKPFCKNKGWECERCPWQYPCWNVPGWEEFYAKTNS